MADSPRRRSPSPLGSPSRSRARARSKSRSRSRSRSGSRGRNETLNPGNTLYVTGLSTRVTERDLEDHFSKEGKVARCFLVVEPRTRISRGFAFVTMDSVEDADLCVKYLNQSVLQGRYITVEKEETPRTPTPGNYLGLKSTRETSFRHDRGRPRGGGGRDEFGGGGSYQRRSPYRGGRDYSLDDPPTTAGRRERSPYSPYRSPDRGYGRRPQMYGR
ncbi:unnamed protein product [Spirodela intermedia]|uniref:RRM domain-containing protein n=1 Tax=Spirodela intermedia TaxID=51605 RepID=A0A7I8J1Q6_SPIIN|nr:unnamed protein product [Spirodela intermedia]CAA6663250.1 unnamed protein product [Spirodela intermedia]